MKQGLIFFSEAFCFSFLFKQESLLNLQSKITKVNCCMASEQMERVLRAYLILVEHANGSKISQPEEVCQVNQTIASPCLPEKYQLNLEDRWSAEALKHSCCTNRLRICVK